MNPAPLAYLLVDQERAQGADGSPLKSEDPRWQDLALVTQMVIESVGRALIRKVG